MFFTKNLLYFFRVGVIRAVYRKLGFILKYCEVSNEKIDELGILGATFKAMHKAISCLIAQSKDLEESIILIDGTINPGFSKKIGSSIKLVKNL